jgi:hypothetical protein
MDSEHTVSFKECQILTYCGIAHPLSDTIFQKKKNYI